MIGVVYYVVYHMILLSIKIIWVKKTSFTHSEMLRLIFADDSPNPIS